MRALRARLRAFSAMAAAAAFERCSMDMKFERALRALGTGSWRRASWQAMARWANAPREMLESALSGELEGAAGPVALGLFGFPAEQQLALADMLAERGAYAPELAGLHAKRWGSLLRCGVAGAPFVRRMVQSGHLDPRALVERHCRQAMALALGFASRGSLSRSPLAWTQARFLAQAAEWEPERARALMASAWEASEFREEDFNAFWARRVERRAMRRSATARAAESSAKRL